MATRADAAYILGAMAAWDDIKTSYANCIEALRQKLPALTSSLDSASEVVATEGNISEPRRWCSDQTADQRQSAHLVQNHPETALEATHGGSA